MKLVIPMMFLAILFVLQAEAQNATSKKNSFTDENGNKVYYLVEDMPEYPGGDKALRKFIAENVKYPKEAIKDSICGKVFIEFTVAENGGVTNAKVARGVHPSLDKEALRVVSSQPLWKPGKQKGKAVNVQYTVPINFALN